MLRDLKFPQKLPRVGGDGHYRRVRVTRFENVLYAHSKLNPPRPENSPCGAIWQRLSNAVRVQQDDVLRKIVRKRDGEPSYGVLGRERGGCYVSRCFGTRKRSFGMRKSVIAVRE